MSAKALSTAEKVKKDKYLYPCMEKRRYFTPMVYSADKNTGTKAIVEYWRSASLLSDKLKQ